MLGLVMPLRILLLYSCHIAAILLPYMWLAAVPVKSAFYKLHLKSTSAVSMVHLYDLQATD